MPKNGMQEKSEVQERYDNFRSLVRLHRRLRLQHIGRSLDLHQTAGLLIKNSYLGQFHPGARLCSIRIEVVMSSYGVLL
jgi:hypothetical protein